MCINSESRIGQWRIIQLRRSGSALNSLFFFISISFIIRWVYITLESWWYLLLRKCCDMFQQWIILYYNVFGRTKSLVSRIGPYGHVLYDFYGFICSQIFEVYHQWKRKVPCLRLYVKPLVIWWVQSGRFGCKLVHLKFILITAWFCFGGEEKNETGLIRISLFGLIISIFSKVTC